MNDVNDENNGEGEFNTPFSGLKKNIKGSRKVTDSIAPRNSSPAGDGQAAARKAGATPSQPQDFSGEDTEAAAMFLSAMGRSVPRCSANAYSSSEQSMAELLAEADKKRRGMKEVIPEASTYQQQAAPMPKPPGRNKSVRDFGDIPLELDGEDAASFASAMQGVKPVDDSRGRALTPPAPAAPIRHKSVERDYLTEFTEGKYEFALECTEEFFEGHVMGLDPLVVSKLRAGNYSPEAHIDLHGLNAEQAYTALLDFVRASYNQGRRNIIVVTGRGKNSPGGLSILRQNMQDWLTKDPFKRAVLAFCTAQPKDGGAGALYVMLRKLKKSQGKIRWERRPGEERPLL